MRYLELYIQLTLRSLVFTVRARRLEVPDGSLGLNTITWRMTMITLHLKKPAVNNVRIHEAKTS